MAIRQRFIGMQRKGICFAEMPPLEEITCGRFCFCYVLPKKQKTNTFGLGPAISWRFVGLAPAKTPVHPYKG